MYKKYLPLLLLLLWGCGDVHETIYLQDVEINGPINHPPIFVTDNNSGIRISPWFSSNSISQVTGKTNSYLTDSITNFGQNNVRWNIPNVIAGVDIDLPISKKVSIFGSFNYSSQNSYEMAGGSFGFGFHSVTNTNAIRFNLGCSIQQYQYDAYTIIVKTVDPLFGKEYTDTGYFHDINKKSNVNFFGNLTFNTVSENLPINFLFSAAFFSQTLLSFTPENPDKIDYPGGTATTTDTRGEISTTFISFSPGIYLNVTPEMRIVVGVNIAKDIGSFSSESGSFSSGLFIMPFAKIDLMF